jgi:hypothetical protein
MVPPLRDDVAEPLPDTAATVMVPPLRDDVAEPLPDTAATVMVAPLRDFAVEDAEELDDDSPTLMLPASAIKFSSEDAGS